MRLSRQKPFRLRPAQMATWGWVPSLSSMKITGTIEGPPIERPNGLGDLIPGLGGKKNEDDPEEKKDDEDKPDLLAAPRDLL